MHRMTDCYSHQGAFDSWTPGLHQEGSVKERCGFKEATLTWHNCSAPEWLEHLGGQKNKDGSRKINTSKTNNFKT